MKHWVRFSGSVSGGDDYPEVSGGVLVGFTWGKWSGEVTDEIPSRSRWTGISRHYKATPKRGGDAAEGTEFISTLARWGLQRDRRSGVFRRKRSHLSRARRTQGASWDQLARGVSTTTGLPLLFREGSARAKNSLYVAFCQAFG